MDAIEFRLFRKRLQKTHKQLASLLGVSEKSVRFFETGERTVTAHVERQLYFLISRIRSSSIKADPCWVTENCPEDRKVRCPAWEFSAGTTCWLVNGTICKGTVNKSWREKMKVCRKCNVLTSYHTISQGDERIGTGKSTEKKNKFGQLIGNDPKMTAVYRIIEDIAKTNSTIRIQGESGTGKEVVAGTIHQLSTRKDKPFVIINCSAYPDSMLESELFGYEKGAFTGATQRRVGRFEYANGGTIFLDEIAEISANAQVKLLRVLESRKFERLGGNTTVTVDVRIITATNKDLAAEVANGNFREDLFYRLNVIPVYLPPLRDRQNDIPQLAIYFFKRLAKQMGKDIRQLSPEVMQALLQHDWPGNVRELENCLEHAVVMTKTDQIELSNLPALFTGSTISAKPASLPVKDRQIPGNQLTNQLQAVSAENLLSSEKQAIKVALTANKGNVKKTAEQLDISRSTLYSKLKKHDLSKVHFKR